MREGRARAEPARRRVDNNFNMVMTMVEDELWIASVDQRERLFEDVE